MNRVFSNLITKLVLFSSAAIFCQAANAAIVITEVNPNGSSSAYNADWFELTNTGLSAVDITGWKMDDSSNSFATTQALRNVTSIAPGQSVVFVENNDPLTDSTVAANFAAFWFGGSVPPGFTIGAYGAPSSGLSLSSGGDGVNIFNSTGTSMASVSFGSTASAAGATLDNAAGLTGTISTLSLVGVNGAFASATAGEFGSPGSITAVPEPSTLVLAGLAIGAMCFIGRRRNK